VDFAQNRLGAEGIHQGLFMARALMKLWAFLFIFLAPILFAAGEK
jgi:hypothetical protein